MGRGPSRRSSGPPPPSDRHTGRGRCWACVRHCSPPSLARLSTDRRSTLVVSHKLALTRPALALPPRSPRVRQKYPMINEDQIIHLHSLPSLDLDVPYGFLRSYSPKTSRLPTSRCHGVPQAMDESYTILVQPTGFFQPPMCTFIGLSITKGVGVALKNSALQYHTTRPHVHVGGAASDSRLPPPPPPPFLSLFRLTSRQARWETGPPSVFCRIYARASSVSSLG